MTPTRFVFGPRFDLADGPTPEPGNGKADVAVSFVEVDKLSRSVAVDIPAYNVDQFNRLVELRVYLLPPGSEPGTDATAFVQGSLPFDKLDVSDRLEGARVNVPIPPAEPGGQYIGQIVLGFDQ